MHLIVLHSVEESTTYIKSCLQIDNQHRSVICTGNCSYYFESLILAPFVLDIHELCRESLPSMIFSDSAYPTLKVLWARLIANLVRDNIATFIGVTTEYPFLMLQSFFKHRFK